jgi:GTP-binding protein
MSTTVKPPWWMPCSGRAAFSDNQKVDERVMDSMDLERERGITIAAKNCSVVYQGVKINIVDTPGHADFGGEVERALSMADGAILLVDASEGPLPQTRFVLQKALASGLKIIVVINKIDRKDARPEAVLDQVYDLFIDLDASEDQLDFPSVLCHRPRRGGQERPKKSWPMTCTPCFWMPSSGNSPPRFDPQAPFRCWSPIWATPITWVVWPSGGWPTGKAESRHRLMCIDAGGKPSPLESHPPADIRGMDITPVAVNAGEIIILSGIEEVPSETPSAPKMPLRPAPHHRGPEPTVSMLFTINDGPLWAARRAAMCSRQDPGATAQGDAAQCGHPGGETDGDRDAVLVKGRGEFQLAILIETMRREGFEAAWAAPK